MSSEAPTAQLDQPSAERRRQLLPGWLTDRQGSWPFLLVLCIVVFGVSLWQTGDELHTTRFHPDESRWINRAHYINDLTDPTGDAWADRYLTRGQPPMGSYMIGLGLLLQGRDVTTNGPWNFQYGDEYNVNWNSITGNMPSRADLEAARRFNAVLGALTCVFIFLIVTRLTNWVGGLAGGFFMAINPLQITLSSQALADASLVFIIGLTALAAMALAERPSWPRAFLLGVLLGFGASAKLSPLLLAVGLGGIGLLLLFNRWIRQLPYLGKAWALVARGDDAVIHRLAWMLLALPAITYTTFVLSYPYLWPDPVARTKYLFDFRQYEMANQARLWNDRAVDSRIDAMRRVWAAFENHYTSSGRVVNLTGRIIGAGWGQVGIDGIFELAGIILFIGLALRHGIISRHFMALAVLGGQTALIIAGMRVDFNRYYLPILLFLAVSVGILAGEVWSLLPHFLPVRVRSRQRDRASTVVSGRWPATTGQ
ncbi:MAG: phospholipid carrier-dependent glycosyltransferase [Thermomicrobiales bacterium]